MWSRPVWCSSSGAQRQRRIDSDRLRVVFLAPGQVDQPGLLGRARPGEQLPDGGDPPGQRRLHHLRGHRAPLRLPRWLARPPRRRRGGQERSGHRGGQDVLGPRDGLLGEGSDREPPLPRASPQPLGELVEPRAAAPQAGQVGLGRRRVDQDRAGGQRQQHRRPGVLHGGDRVLGLRHIEARQLLGGRLPRGVQRDGVGRGERPGRDRVGLPEELRDLGPPGLRALLALVRDPIVIPGNPVHRGREGILLEPALVETVGQVTRRRHDPPLAFKPGPQGPQGIVFPARACSRAIGRG